MSGVDFINQTCTTKECIEISKSILDYIDFNVDPCSDFYQYTCGSWLKQAKIPDDKSSTGTLDKAGDDIMETLKTILEGTHQEAYLNPAHQAFPDPTDQDLFRQMKTYYDLCMDTTTLDQLGTRPLDLHHLTDRNLTDLLTEFNQLGINSLTTTYVDTDDRDPDRYTVFFSQVSLGLPSKEYFEDPVLLERYRLGLIEVIEPILGKEFSIKVVQQFIQLERQLAKISIKNEDLQDPVKLYNPMDFKTFKARYPSIGWDLILKRLVKDLPEQVVVLTPEYYDALERLLPTLSDEVMTSYFQVTYTINKIHALDKRTREAYRRMTGEIYSGSQVEQPRWRFCVGHVSNTFSNGLGRFYTMKVFGTEEERMKAEGFLQTIHDAWLGLLPGVDWLDEITLKKAKEKVELIKHKVGYSVISPDIRDPVSIKNELEGLKINETSFYDTEEKISIWFNQKMWKKLGKPMDKDEWFMSPQTVNAYYSPNTNEIAIPAGILQNPFYDRRFPEYLNYGGIGAVIGHELTHAFDSSGRKYDGYGHLKDWWTNETSHEFDIKTQCFIDQYSKFHVTGPDNKTVQVNGKLTLAENLADNGGVTASLKAFHDLKEKKENRLLPNLDLKPEALFFINFARFWCSKERDKLSVQMIYTDEHSPSHARVNGVVQNSEEFSTTFNCPVGSPMNPVKKCKMW